VLVPKQDLRTPADTSQISLEEDWEVEYWCDRFDVNEATLRTCVMKFGPRADDVEARLRHAGAVSFKNDGED
jgi:hypothetical protein